MTASVGAVSVRTQNRRTVGWVFVVLLVITVVAAVSVSSKPSDVPFDSSSPAPLGTKAMVELVRSFGSQVDVATAFPPSNADVAIMFEDVVPSSRVDEVRRWVSEGHTLVVAEPASELTPLATPAGPIANNEISVKQADCDISALSDVHELSPGIPIETSPAMYHVTPDMAVCFSNESFAFVVLTVEGAGTIVSIGSAEPFVNRSLDQRDDAVLATSLLAPHPGTRVSILDRKTFGGIQGDPGQGPGGALGRIFTLGPGLLLLELLVAAVVFSWYHGRRVGKPVLEPLPVRIAGSELVAAVGNLLERAGNPSNAGAMLRADLRREICRRMGLPPQSFPEIIADTITTRLGIERDRVLSILVNRPLHDEAALVALAVEIDALREAVLHPRTQDIQREESLS